MQPPAAAPPRRDPAEPPYDPALVVARIGAYEVVQASEMLPTVYQQLKEIEKNYADQLAALTPEARRQQLQPAERQIMKAFLEQMVQMKLLLADVRSKAPPEGVKANEASLRKTFNDEYIKTLMTQYGAASTVDLENKLRELGSSIDAQRTLFVERQLAFGWLAAQVKDEPEPTHEQLLTYYRAHLGDWDVPSKARWEHLMVKFLNFESKQAAREAIARWGDEILVRGVPWAEVAKAHSQDYTASLGGMNDWTSQGTLKSEVLDRALFALPVGAMSPILEDEDGLHIIRVVERTEFRRPPFSEIQGEIKEKIDTRNKERSRLEYIAKLREKIPVWTIFDATTPATASQGAGPRR